MVSNEFKDAAGFVLGPILGILEGVYNVGAGIVNLRPLQVGLGLFQIAAVGLTPRLGADGGLAHPSEARAFQPLLNPDYS
jgi:hypothetical protein